MNLGDVLITPRPVPAIPAPGVGAGGVAAPGGGAGGEGADPDPDGVGGGGPGPGAGVAPVMPLVFLLDLTLASFGTSRMPRSSPTFSCILRVPLRMS